MADNTEAFGDPGESNCSLPTFSFSFKIPIPSIPIPDIDLSFSFSFNLFCPLD